MKVVGLLCLFTLLLCCFGTVFIGVYVDCFGALVPVFWVGVKRRGLFCLFPRYILWGVGFDGLFFCGIFGYIPARGYAFCANERVEGIERYSTLLGLFGFFIDYFTLGRFGRGVFRVFNFVGYFTSGRIGRGVN